MSIEKDLQVDVATCICNLATLSLNLPNDVSSNLHGILTLSGVNSVAQMGALHTIRTSIAGPSLITVQ